MEYFIGIDIGGTTVKALSVTADGNIIKEASRPTPYGDGDALSQCIFGLCEELFSGDCALSGIGVGCPGMISDGGNIILAANLGLENYPLGEELARRLGVKVKVTNDANAAALGEAKFGAGKNYSDSILVTLGTGVGGGIIIGGKIFAGNKSVGAEIGHMVIKKGGLSCTCGRRGCFEAYASATALIKKTVEEAKKHPQGIMARECPPEKIDGRTAFVYADKDGAAKKAFNWYISNLACGLANLANVFRPQVIMLGGGISGQGEALCAPLRKKFDKEVFGGNKFAKVELISASLGNRAGALGAAAFVMN